MEFFRVTVLVLYFLTGLSTFTQHIKVEKYNDKISGSQPVKAIALLSSLRIHEFQLTEDAAVISGQKQESHIQLNRFIFDGNRQK